MKVSICVPTYNCAEFIERTINSILDQTYHDFELIISDNGSTDETLKKLQSYKDKRIKLFHNEHPVHVANNWNKCINSSSGELIALFHGDDLYDRKIIEEQVKVFNRIPELGAVYCSAYIIDEKDNMTGTMFVDDILQNGSKIDFKKAFLSYINSGRGSFVSPSAMIQKKVYKDIGLYDAGFDTGLDYDLYFRVLEKYPAYIITEKLMSYRIHDKQGSSKELAKHVNPNPIFKLINKFISSPSLTIKLTPKIIKDTKLGEKADLYACAVTAIGEKRYDDAGKYINKASGIYTGLLDIIVRTFIGHGMERAAGNLIKLKYGS